MASAGTKNTTIPFAYWQEMKARAHQEGITMTEAMGRASAVYLGQKPDPLPRAEDPLGPLSATEERAVKRVLRIYRYGGKPKSSLEKLLDVLEENIDKRG